MISEFALEYRTAKERVESQKKKRHQRGERNRTRGKMILEVSGESDFQIYFSTKVSKELKMCLKLLWFVCSFVAS